MVEGLFKHTGSVQWYRFLKYLTYYIYWNVACSLVQNVINHSTFVH